jgi:hypothetical protein
VAAKRRYAGLASLLFGVGLLAFSLSSIRMYYALGEPPVFTGWSVWARLGIGLGAAMVIAGAAVRGGLPWPQRRQCDNMPPMPPSSPDARHAITWTDLATEVRFLSNKDLKVSWPQRFLPALQNIEEGKGFPGFVKLFSELAEENDWSTLRDLLPDVLDGAERFKVPPPKL